jgi:hypothetical protein
MRENGNNIIEYSTGGASFLFMKNPKNHLVAGETDGGWLRRLVSEIEGPNVLISFTRT